MPTSRDSRVRQIKRYQSISSSKTTPCIPPRSGVLMTEVLEDPRFQRKPLRERQDMETTGLSQVSRETQAVIIPAIRSYTGIVHKPLGRQQAINHCVYPSLRYQVEWNGLKAKEWTLTSC